jgi:hypothetical protein
MAPNHAIGVAQSARYDWVALLGAEIACNEISGSIIGLQLAKLEERAMSNMGHEKRVTISHLARYRGSPH